MSSNITDIYSIIPDDFLELIYPELACANEDLPRIELPCGGVMLKFIIGKDDLTWDEFHSWDVSIAELSKIAGLNAFSYNTWETKELDLKKLSQNY